MTNHPILTSILLLVLAACNPKTIVMNNGDTGEPTAEQTGETGVDITNTGSDSGAASETGDSGESDTMTDSGSDKDTGAATETGDSTEETSSDDTAAETGETDETDETDTDTDPVEEVDNDEDGVSVADGDCDDSRDDVYPFAPEYCDGADNDCNSKIDDGVGSIWYRDSDGDGYGDAAVSMTACTQPAGYIADATDCDDHSSAQYPGATEYMNGQDDDCDGTVDEADAATEPETDPDSETGSTWYRDSDGDGYGNSAVTTTATTAPSGYVANNTDCDDSSASVHPGTIESNNGTDDDCDGETDEGFETETGGETGYEEVDADGDGHYEDADCDDSDPSVNPDATEIYNGIDDDCDGEVDEGVTPATTYTWYRDSDGDGYGNSAVTTTATTQPSGYVANSTDCDDSSESINPGEGEVAADSTDNDCDGIVDNGLTVTVDSAKVGSDWTLCYDTDGGYAHWWGGSVGCTNVSAGTYTVTIDTAAADIAQLNGACDTSGRCYLVEAGPSWRFYSIEWDGTFLSIGTGTEDCLPLSNGMGGYDMVCEKPVVK